MTQHPPVRPRSRKVTVRITVNDIRRGKPGDPCSCPIARAIKRLSPKSRPSVRLGSCAVYFGSVACGLPAKARRWAYAFDAGKDCKPMEFEMEIPAWLPMKKCGHCIEDEACGWCDWRDG